MVGHEDVHGVGDRAAERGHHADRAEASAPAPEVDDERQAGEAEGQREPEPAADGLVHEEAGPEGDQHGRDVLDDEGDADVEATDRDEIKEMDEGEPEDAEEREVAELAKRDAQAPRPDERDRAKEEERRAGRARLGEAQDREPSPVTTTLASTPFNDHRATAVRTRT